MKPHVTTPVEGLELLQDYLLDRPVETPEDVRQRLRDLVKPGVSAVVSSVEAAELIYARRDELAGPLLEIGAQLAAMCALYNFHGLAIDGRGAGMAAAIRSMEAVASVAPEPAGEPPAPRANLVSPSPSEGAETAA